MATSLSVLQTGGSPVRGEVLCYACGKRWELELPGLEDPWPTCCESNMWLVGEPGGVVNAPPFQEASPPGWVTVSVSVDVSLGSSK